MPGKKVPETERREQILAATYKVAAEQGLWETTILQVAAAANVSPGLILFHFESRRQLLLALLEQVLATTTVLAVPPEVEELPAPIDRLITVMRLEMSRLISDPMRIRLTFDFWMAGVRDPAMRAKLQDEFARYRDAFLPLAEAVLHAEPDRFPGVTAQGLAGLSVSLVKGCALQSMIDSERFDVDDYLAAAAGLMSHFVAASSTPDQG